MLLAVQKSLAETMKGCKSAMLGKAKAKSEGQSKPLAKTRSCRPSGTLASVRTSCSLSRSMCISNECFEGGLSGKRIAAHVYSQCRWQALDRHFEHC